MIPDDQQSSGAISHNVVNSLFLRRFGNVGCFWLGSRYSYLYLRIGISWFVSRHSRVAGAVTPEFEINEHTTRKQSHGGARFLGCLVYVDVLVLGYVI